MSSLSPWARAVKRLSAVRAVNLSSWARALERAALLSILALSFWACTLATGSDGIYVTPASGGTGSPSILPAVPAGLSVDTPTVSSLSVRWTASEGASSYLLFRDTSAAGSFSAQVYSGANAAFTDASLSGGTTYYYKVKASSNSGTSAFSAAASGTTIPQTPSGLAAGSPTTTSLTLAWNPSTGASSYRLYRDSSAGGAFSTQVYSGAAAAYVNTGLAASTTYWYKVLAVGASGESPLSSAISGATASPSAPPVPTGLTVGSATSTSLTVSWSASAGATGYIVTRDTSAAGAFSTQAYTGAGTSFTDSPLSSSTTYYYRVQAVNASGASAVSAAVSGTTLAGAPGSPAGLTVGSPTSGSLAIGWSTVTGATSYQLYRDTSAAGAFTTQVYTGAAASYVNTGLAASTTYWYKVRATNAYGSSALSAAVSGTTTAAVPASCTASCHNASVPPNPIPTGRHNSHVNSYGYACTTCHNGWFTTSTHMDGTLQTSGFVTFDSKNPSGTWIDSSGTCSSLSCHGSRTW